MEHCQNNAASMEQWVGSCLHHQRLLHAGSAHVRDFACSTEAAEPKRGQGVGFAAVNAVQVQACLAHVGDLACRRKWKQIMVEVPLLYMQERGKRAARLSVISLAGEQGVHATLA
jgi:hypothetical protein